MLSVGRESLNRSGYSAHHDNNHPKHIPDPEIEMITHVANTEGPAIEKNEASSKTGPKSEKERK